MTTETEMYLSRAHLRNDAPVSAIRELLAEGDQIRAAAGHRLVWSLFADDPERRRDFLWREAEPGTFYLLSQRPPEDRHGLFRIDPPKRFAPALLPGDRLRFVLRANATVARISEGKVGANGRVRGGRCDVVMDAIHSVPAGERAGVRRDVLPGIAIQWLARQGEGHGFSLAEQEDREDWEVGGSAAVQVAGYRVLRIGRGRRARPMEVGVLDMTGTLMVRDPGRFLVALGRGFGRAKAFGCGLMLVRRAP